jgi:hypothetical protein
MLHENLFGRQFNKILRDLKILLLLIRTCPQLENHWDLKLMRVMEKTLFSSAVLADHLGSATLGSFFEHSSGGGGARPR